MKISDQLKEIPNTPGVYLFHDQSGTILYVGKAINLKGRVRSYFSDAHADRPWIKVMIGLIEQIETIVVSNELEALMLEATLIKQHLPKFNIKLTDDKAYPYIKLSKNEPIPRFSIVRRQQTKTDGYYFGPYLSGRSARYTLEFLRELYGIHLSDRPLKTNQNRPCFNCQLTSHPCPLNNEIEPEIYNEKVDAAVRFLQGKRKNLVKDLEAEMERAAELQQFERAAKLRDRLQATRQVVTSQGVVSTNLEDYDAIGLAGSHSLASLTLLRIRDGRVNSHHHFFFESIVQAEPSEIIRTFLTTMYQNLGPIPPLIALPNQIEDQDLLEAWFRELSGHAVELRFSERGEKRQLVEMAKRNAESKLQTRLVRTDRSFEGLVALRELLGLADLPERIEAVDISNLGASEPVGAVICFINGQPDKNEYRRYIIKQRYYKKTPKENDYSSNNILREQNDYESNLSEMSNIRQVPNDFAMVREVVARRLLDTTRPLPDLLVIDGGPEQLKFALDAVQASENKPKFVLSLAKKPDRIFLPERKSPIPAARNNKGLLLLSRIRDEVHRFGIGFQRARQKKKSLGTTSS